MSSQVIVFYRVKKSAGTELAILYPRLERVTSAGTLQQATGIQLIVTAVSTNCNFSSLLD